VIDASHLYWANYGNGTIVEANLGGVTRRRSATGQSFPTGVVDGFEIMTDAR
jgi:hypothetical protein